MKLNTTLAGIALIVLCSWTIQTDDQLKKANWLIGTWENKTARGSMYETWGKVNDNEFAGKSYILKDKDSVVFETLKLVAKEGSLFYIPTVKNQNSGLPVSFSLKTISENEMVFENQKHDFPQLISYKRIRPDSLVAEISGVKNGQNRKQTFPMRKIK